MKTLIIMFNLCCLLSLISCGGGQTEKDQTDDHTPGEVITDPNTPDPIDPDPTPEVTLNNIIMSINASTLMVGDSTKATVTGEYSDNTNKPLTQNISWASTEDHIATIDATGTIQATSTGQTTITASVADFTKSFDITVIQAQENGNLTMQVDADKQLITLAWNENNFKDDYGYKIQTQLPLSAKGITSTTDSDTWQTIVEWPTGLGDYIYQQAANQGERLRVVAVHADKVLTGAQGTREFITPDASDFTLLFTQNGETAEEPFSDVIKLSIASAITPVSVNYFVDTKKVGTGGSAPSFAYSLKTNNLVNAEHRFEAQIEYTNNSYILISQNATAFNNNLTVSGNAQKMNDAQASVAINARASSRLAITKVELYINGNLQTILTEPNSCSLGPWCDSQLNQYQWVWPTIGLTPGEYTFEVKAFDESGAEKSYSFTYTLNNKPTVSLSLPIDQDLVGDNLVVKGQAYDDEGAPLVTVKLGDILLYADYANEFETSHNMSGLPNGTYLITIDVKDASGQLTRIQRNVLYSSTVAQNATFLYKLGADTNILSIKDGHILYEPQSTQILTGNVNSSAITGYTIDDSSIFWSYQSSATLVRDLIQTADGRYAFSFGRHIFQLEGDVLTNATINMYENSGVFGVGRFPSVSQNKIVSNFVTLSRWLYVYDIPSQTGQQIEYSSRYEWQFGPVQTNDNWLCHAHWSANHEYDVAIMSYSNINQFIEITPNNSANEKCIGIKDNQFYYTSSPVDGSPTSLFKANFAAAPTSTLISDEIQAANQVKFTPNLLVYVKTTNKTLIAKTYMHEYQIATNAVLKNITDTAVTYTINNQLYVWRLADQVSHLIWPAADTHYIDNDAVYIIRGNDNLMYKMAF